MMKLLSFRNRLVSSIRMLSSEAAANNEVLFEVKNDVGIITLNRPRVLNSLNTNMVQAIHKKLKEWELSCSFVLVQGAGDKAFCAGGDVVAATKDKNAGKEFFRNEYKMNYLIGKYRIPYISILDGITMGGGVGISMHGKFRIATEKTLFAMPETAIGLFPDVGGSYFLPNLQGKLGLFLGLTGYRLQGTETLLCGIATHFISSKKVPKLVDKLINFNEDVSELPQFLKDNTEDVWNVGSRIAEFFPQIDGIFSTASVEDILKELYRDGSLWSKDIASMLRLNSPTALKITKHQLDLGSYMELKDCLKMEYRLACAALDKKITADFYEGVRAQLIDKDKSPNWHPRDILDVPDEMIFKVFEELPHGEELDI